MYYYYRLILVYHSSCTLSILDQNVPFCNYSSFIMNTWCTDTLLPMWVFKIWSKIIHDPSETLAILFPDTSPSNENIGCVFPPLLPNRKLVASDSWSWPGHFFPLSDFRLGLLLEPICSTLIETRSNNLVCLLFVICHIVYIFCPGVWIESVLSTSWVLVSTSGNLSSKLSEFYTGRKQYSWHDNMMSAWLAFRFGGAVYSYPWFLCYKNVKGV